MKKSNNYTKKNTEIIKKHQIKSLVIIATLLSVSCGDNSASSGDQQNKQRLQLEKANADDTVNDESIKEENEVIKRSTPSYISQNNRPCPKLLQRKVDTSLISRNKEFLHGKYCDYYLYPNINQKLSVDTHGANVKVSLVMPSFQSLDNQSHTITENKRHVIRVEYNGTQKQPKDFSYDITINLEDED